MPYIVYKPIYSYFSEQAHVKLSVFSFNVPECNNVLGTSFTSTGSGMIGIQIFETILALRYRETVLLTSNYVETSLVMTV